jgi:GDP-4-dehydro-6-deoxy-D-mannose reductase
VRVLITGIAGFVGTYLAGLLRQMKFDIIGIDRLVQPVKNKKNDIQIYNCDLSDFNETQKRIHQIKPNTIFHLAALSSVKQSFQEPKLTIETNIKSTLNILESVRQHEIKCKILLITSGDIYGNVDKNNLPIREDQYLRPVSPYAFSKACVDLLGYQYYHSYNQDIIRIRPFNHIGPRQSLGFVIQDFASQIAKIEKYGGNRILKVGNIDVKRDFTDVRDIVKGYYLASEKCTTGEAYNICSGKAYPLIDILEILISYSKIKFQIERSTSHLRATDIPILVGDYSRLQAKTGWEPAIPIENSLLDILNYWRNTV